MNQKGILLESGTNELEVVEFTIGANKFGINVIKVKEILLPVPVTRIPHSHPSVEGIMDIRGEVVPVVDVAHMLGFPPSEQPAHDKFILSEFNQTRIVFHVHTVTQIHRISWGDIEKPDKMYQGLETQVNGVVKVNDEMVLLLDFEQMIANIHPESTIQKDQIKRLGERQRMNKQVLIAEDSALLRAMLEETLHEAGYENVTAFENGKEALDYLLQLDTTEKQIEEYFQLVITDIEMPQMDGHHLTKRIKEEDSLKGLPVIIFSSLITDDLRHKGELVGADAQISKPEIASLVEHMDRLVL
ncbi:chemotaxis protein CheV [Pontibacillus halophilus JSM 076056 = DSM 19796]|uniref:Chemotaxis protein CheV n=2 Tax=Pontibacillus TaxID=289201 RepID=A0A0A5GHW3_9BACI|nr:chemotaxis protein CheV [Pontibacillus halophilus JSM 076056 = DSM 19796]